MSHLEVRILRQQFREVVELIASEISPAHDTLLFEIITSRRCPDCLEPMPELSIECINKYCEGKLQG